MSTELLDYCLTQLLLSPRELVVNQPVDLSARKNITNLWAYHRFKEQQRSILSESPDHELYGRGYLWFYAIDWSENPKDPSRYHLRIFRQEDPTPSPREAILLASVLEGHVPFPGSRAVFRATKARMLCRESQRSSGAVHRQLRAAVANVQFLCQDGHNYVTAVIPADVVDITF